LPASNLKVALTTTEGSTGKKPHQAFLTLREVDTGLEESFAFSVKESGKGKVDLVWRKRLNSPVHVFRIY
jgi:oligosaccharyltransferase complex subunit delta (ribophorin II)